MKENPVYSPTPACHRSRLTGAGSTQLACFYLGLWPPPAPFHLKLDVSSHVLTRNLSHKKCPVPFRSAKPCFKTFLKSTMWFSESLNFKWRLYPAKNHSRDWLLECTPSFLPPHFPDALCSSWQKRFRFWLGTSVPLVFCCKCSLGSGERRMLPCFLTS